MSDPTRLDGKAAVVTGAGGGIGRATSLELARAGASVLLVDVNETSLAESAEAVGAAGTEVRTAVADVSQSQNVRAYVDTAIAAFGKIDVFFNNAGIEGAVAPVHEYPEEDFDRVIAVNLRGVFLGLKYVLPGMIERGYGSVINTASMAGERGLPGTSAYIASKHAVIGLTRAAASDLGSAGVRVNAICPGVIDTRMSRAIAAIASPDDPEAGLRHITGVAPLSRLGAPEEVAAAVRFLASDAASFVNGVAFPIDGGALAVMR